jgi:hypothetical protein
MSLSTRVENLQIKVNLLEAENAALVSAIETCMDYAANMGDQLTYDTLEAALAVVNAKQ